MTAWKCQCTNPDCNLEVELPDDIIQDLCNYKWCEFHRYDWITIVNGCIGSPPDGYKLLQRNADYNIYSPAIEHDIESAIETADIVNDPEMMEAFSLGISALERGDFITLEQLEKELDL